MQILKSNLLNWNYSSEASAVPYRCKGSTTFLKGLGAPYLLFVARVCIIYGPVEFVYC